MKTEITLAQIQSVFGKPQQNLKKVLQIIASLQTASNHILLLPELWTSGFDLKQAHQHVHADRDILQILTLEAHARNIWIAGSYITQDADGLYNTFILLGPQGQVARYRKLHLIRLMNEQRWFQPGAEMMQINTGFAQIGASVCYDLRFPVLYQNLAHAGCNLFLLPAAWPLKRIDHWNTLCAARAIENQAFFAACNAVGGTHRETFGGNSMLLTPWGESLFHGDSQHETIQTICIDVEQAFQIRESFPVIEEQKEDQRRSIPLKSIQFSGEVSKTDSVSS